MRGLRLFVPLLILVPARAIAHSGAPHVRTGPEPSDIALFAVAAVGVCLARRALRARFAERSDPTPPAAED